MITLPNNISPTLIECIDNIKLILTTENIDNTSLDELIAEFILLEDIYLSMSDISEFLLSYKTIFLENTNFKSIYEYKKNTSVKLLTINAIISKTITRLNLVDPVLIDTTDLTELENELVYFSSPSYFYYQIENGANGLKVTKKTFLEFNKYKRDIIDYVNNKFVEYSYKTQHFIIDLTNLFKTKKTALSLYNETFLKIKKQLSKISDSNELFNNYLVSKNELENIKHDLLPNLNKFNSLMHSYTMLEIQINDLFKNLESNSSIVKYIAQNKFETMLVDLQNYIKIISGLYDNVDSIYFISDIKKFLDDLITLSKELGLPITFKYNKNGLNISYSFNSYETDKFLIFFKELYYDLNNNALNQSLSLVDIDDAYFIEAMNRLNDARNDTEAFLEYIDGISILDDTFLIIQENLEKKLSEFKYRYNILLDYSKKIPEIYYTSLEPYLNSNLNAYELANESAKNWTDNISKIIQNFEVYKKIIDFESTIRDIKKYPYIASYFTYLFDSFYHLFDLGKLSIDVEKKEIIFGSNFYSFENENKLEFTAIDYLVKCLNKIDAEIKINNLLEPEYSLAVFDKLDNRTQYTNSLVNINDIKHLISSAIVLMSRKNIERPNILKKDFNRLSDLFGYYVSKNLILSLLIDYYMLSHNLSSEFKSEFENLYIQDKNNMIKFLDQLELNKNKNVAVDLQDLKTMFERVTNIQIAMHYSYDLLISKKTLLDYKTKIINKTILIESEIMSFVKSNNIPEISIVEISTPETIKSTVPLEVKMNATDVIGSSNAEFIWYFSDGQVKHGTEISHVFYNESVEQVRCECIVANKVDDVKIINFNLSGRSNSSFVKENILEYSPLNPIIKSEKLIYSDPVTNLNILTNIRVNGNILDMLANGTIYLTEGDPFSPEKAGLVVLGYKGAVLPGEEFKNSDLYLPDFEFDMTSEFLFDFKVSEPIVKKSVIDISESKFITAMFKVPIDFNESIYNIDVKSLLPFTSNTLQVIPGDIVVFKNNSSRYAIVEILDVNEINSSEIGSDDFNIKFKYLVNTSDNKANYANFKPVTNFITVDKLIFNRSILSMFNIILDNNTKKQKLIDLYNSSIDIESKNILKYEIEKISDYSMTSFINEKEYIKSNIEKFSYLTGLVDQRLNATSESTIEELNNAILFFKDVDNSFQGFKEYKNTIVNQTFDSNYFVQSTLIKIFKDMYTMVDILENSFLYYEKDIQFYKDKINLLHFDIDSINFLLTDKKEIIIDLVKKIRTRFFQYKLIFSFLIDGNDEYFTLSNAFIKQTTMKDEIINNYYLFEKKLEIMYGSDILSNKNYSDFSIVEHVYKLTKSTGLIGISQEEIFDLSNHINAVETLAINSYDAYFMLNLWISYLTLDK